MPGIAAGVIMPWPTTVASIPAGWTRVASLDSRFVKQIATSSTAPGATGGTPTHTHSFSAHPHQYASHNHAGTWGESLGASGGFDSNNQGVGTNHANGHTHPTSSTGTAVGGTSNNATPTLTDATANDPLHVTVIFVQSDGTPTGIPVNGLAWFNGAAPAGWAVYSALDNRLMKGAAVGAGGGTQAGATAHTHTSAAHSHPIGGSHSHVAALDVITVGTLNNSSGSAVAGNHGHTLGSDPGTSNPANSDTATETSGTADHDPPWQKMRAIQKITSTAMTVGMICLWLGSLASIPAGWHLCDGTASTPNLSQGKYVRAAASDVTVGDLGGSATHTHAAGTAHSHTTTGTHTHAVTAASGFSGTQDSVGGPANTAFYGNHNHGSKTYTSSAAGIGTSDAVATTQVVSGSLDPDFTGVAYIRLQSLDPNAPTINTPADSSVFNNSITLSATATDPDGDSWRSEWEYSPNSGTDWFSVPGDGSTVASGVASTLLWDTTALSQAATYKMRVWAIDANGQTSAVTTQTGVFTIDHNLDPNAPTLNSPAAGFPWEGSISQVFSWTFSDPNGGDTQSAYALKLRRTSDNLTRWWDGSAWQTVETYVTTGTQSATPTAGPTGWAKGDTWNWTVRTKDQGGPSGVKTGPYATERTILTSTKVNPTISVPDVPTVIPTAYFTMTWAVTEQTKFRARLLLGPSFTTVIQDTGEITDSAARDQLLGPQENGTTVRYEIRTWNNEGLLSNIVTRDKTVTYTVGPTPTLVLTART